MARSQRTRSPDSAKETYAHIDEENPNLDAASRASLTEACALFALADDLAEQVAKDGCVVAGSAGQPAAHPLLAEIRLYRVQAMAALKALGIAQNQSAASKAGAALAMKRHHGRIPGVRSVKWARWARRPQMPHPAPNAHLQEKDSIAGGGENTLVVGSFVLLGVVEGGLPCGRRSPAADGRRRAPRRELVAYLPLLG